MLTRLVVRNFKQFAEADIELGSPVVFIGPNNSGKTTALQALALWDIGVKRWMARRGRSSTASRRTGVAINRHDLLAIPVPAADLLWRPPPPQRAARERRAAHAERADRNHRGGVSDGRPWTAGMEFDYANDSPSTAGRCAFPVAEAAAQPIAFLPMSGLTANGRLDPGAINVRIGEGRTAEVLRAISAVSVQLARTVNSVGMICVRRSSGCSAPLGRSTSAIGVSGDVYQGRPRRAPRYLRRRSQASSDAAFVGVHDAEPGRRASPG
ncbi:MAG: ATP-binding protein [Dehalococcoidia bacterium]